MDENQKRTFLYVCSSEALSLHFNNSSGIVRSALCNKRLEESTFSEALERHKRVFKEIKTGFCFSMSSFVFGILEDMDVQDFYFMESANSMWSNFVILYKTNEGYRICDLAAQVRKNEEFIGMIMNADVAELEKIQKSLKDNHLLCQTIEDYTSHYPIQSCKVLLHKGNEDELYNEVPRMPLNAFLSINELPSEECTSKHI